MTPHELRAKSAELERKAQALTHQAAKENRDLTEDEETSLKGWLDESDKLKARAARIEEIDARVTATVTANSGAQRTTEPIQFNSLEPGEGERDRKASFADWLYHVDVACDHRSSFQAKEDSRAALENQYRSQFRRWDDPKRSKEVRGLALSSGTSGGFLMPEQFWAQLLSVAAPMSLVRQRATVIPANAQTIKIPSLDQTTAQTAGSPPYYGGVILTWTGEAVSIGSTQPGFRQTVVDLHELTGYTPVSRTLLQYSPISLEPLIYNLFGGAVSWAEDYAFLRGNGVGKPLGVLDPTVAARIKTSDRGSSTAVTFANFTDMWVQVLPESQNVGAWFVSKAVEAQVLKATGTANSVFFPTGVYMANSVEINAGPANGASGVMIFMRPVLVSTKLPGADVDGDINFFDFSKYVIADGGPPEIASSDDYLFRTNERAFRVVHRVGGAPWLNSYITMEDASTTLSPFVSMGIH